MKIDLDIRIYFPFTEKLYDNCFTELRISSKLVLIYFILFIIILNKFFISADCAGYARRNQVTTYRLQGRPSKNQLGNRQRSREKKSKIPRNIRVVL